MRRRLVGLLLPVVLLAAGALPAFPEGPLSAEAERLLLQVHAPDWTAALGAGLAQIAADRPVPPAAVDFVLGAVGPGALPADPVEAAGVLAAAARAADAARRRGVALPLLRVEIRRAWESMAAGGTPFSLRWERRAQGAMEGFVSGNRRSWDPSYVGRGGSDAGSPGPGPGGRW